MLYINVDCLMISTFQSVTAKIQTSNPLYSNHPDHNVIYMDPVPRPTNLLVESPHSVVQKLLQYVCPALTRAFAASIWICRLENLK